ncbi:unnamed protein product [Rhizopus stolonifer]
MPAINSSLNEMTLTQTNYWSLWLESWKEPRKRKLIIKEMLKPISKVDKDGYIYGYSVNENHLTEASFKIGRTINPHTRMYSLARSCEGKPFLMELFPGLSGKVPENNRLDRVVKCPVTHRVEKLILMEMAISTDD